MKLKRTKLAALAMTALMAVGAMSLVSYAATDEAATVADNAAVVNPGNVKSYTLNSDGTYTVYCAMELDGKDTGDTYAYTASVDSSTAATCTKGSTVTITYTVAGKVYTYTITNDDATGHTYTKTDTVIETYATHTATGSGYTTTVCSVCGAEKDASARVYFEIDKVKHTASSTIEYLFVGQYTAATSADDFDDAKSAESAATTYGYTGNIKTTTDSTTGATIIAKGSDGLPQAADVTKDAYYLVRTTCTSGDGYIYSLVKIPATTAAYAVINYSTSTNITSIDGVANGYTETTLSNIPYAQNSVALADCSKSGSYTVTYYYSDGKSATQTITVAAHHREVVALAFTSTDDGKACSVTYKSNNTYSIVNNSCYKTITYYELTFCTECGATSGTALSSYTNLKVIGNNSVAGVSTSSYKMLSVTAKTVAPSGSHSISSAVKSAIAAEVKAGASYVTIYKDFTTGKYSAYKDFVSFTDNTSTCTTAGTVVVQYLCQVCGEVVETETISVSAAGHSEAGAVVENFNAASCSSTGSYEAVVYCANKSLLGCTYEYSRTTVLLPRTLHTNELQNSTKTNGELDPDLYDTQDAENVEIQFIGSTVIVDPSDGKYLDAGVGSTIGEKISTATGDYKYYIHVGDETYLKSLGTYVVVVTKCDVCGYEIKTRVPATVKITSITKEKSNGEAGSITLTATYTNDSGTFTATQTFDYYSTLAAYYSRTETTPISGLNLDSDGVYRYYVDGVVATSYTGFVTYNGEEFFVASGVLCDSINGLAEYDGTFYYLAGGQLQADYTGMVEYNGEWFYITSGILDTAINGIVEYDGGSFLVAAGRLVQEYSGLYQDFDGTWYFLANGQVQSQFTGVTYYDGAFFKLVNGVLDDSFNGTIEYDGATFNVVAGQLYDQVA